jgi:hypothetical protein
MIQPKTGDTAGRDIPAASVALVDARDRLLDRWAGKGMSSGRNLHHRQLRRTHVHTASNLVTLSGSGTTGTHGMVHHNRAVAQRYGFIIPSWVDDIAAVPIRVASAYGIRSWATFDDEGNEHALHAGQVPAIMRKLGLWADDENWL